MNIFFESARVISTITYFNEAIPKPSTATSTTTSNNINQSWGPKTGAANISQVNNTQQQRAPVTNTPVSFSKPTTPAPTTTTTTTSTVSNTSYSNTASGNLVNILLILTFFEGSRPNMFGPTGGYKPPVAAAGDETIRTKPIQKPKPDQNRASGRKSINTVNIDYFIRNKANCKSTRTKNARTKTVIYC